MFKSEEAIKEKIVDGYRRGVCTKDGATIPLCLRGGSYGGSCFMPRSKEYVENYSQIDWSKR